MVALLKMQATVVRKLVFHVSAACRNVAEPETESFHLGVSLGGLEADGGVTKDAVWNCYCRLPCKKSIMSVDDFYSAHRG